MSDFAFSDLGRVHWASTAKLTLARGFMAGLVWAILISVGPGGVPPETALAWPFVWAFIALPLALLLQVIGMIFAAFMPLLGLWFTLAGSLFVCIGDPIVYLLNRSFPTLLNVADLRIINFRPMIFITNPQ